MPNCFSFLVFNDKGAIWTSSVEPVSYTHLDVYKRQGLGESIGAITEDAPIGSKTITASLTGVSAVSYTHLDVYKRQVFTPYREQYKQVITTPKMHYVETYNASEGYFGTQDVYKRQWQIKLHGINRQLLPAHKTGIRMSGPPNRNNRNICLLYTSPPKFPLFMSGMRI